MDFNKIRNPADIARNNRNMEAKNYNTITKSARKRRYRHIIEALGDRKVSLEDLGLGIKNRGVLDAVLSEGGSLDDYVVLQQYAKAIIEGDTKAAEFIRDTSGQKPTNVVDMTTTSSGLSEMSVEELRELKEALEENVATEENTSSETAPDTSLGSNEE